LGPDDKNTIGLDSWLKSLIVCMHGVKVDRYLKQAKKIHKTMPEETRITYKEFIAFQYLLQNMDMLKSKVSQYKYMDYDMFCDVIQAFCA